MTERKVRTPRNGVINHDTKSANCVRGYGCDRPECIDRARKYHNRTANLRRMNRATSKEQWTEAEPFIQRLKDLQAKGYTLGQLARGTGVKQAHIQGLVSARAPKKIEVATAKKIAEAHMTEAPKGPVPILGTRRRLRSLLRDGHTRESIATALTDMGVPTRPSWITSISSNPTTRSRNFVEGFRAAAVDDLFEKWVMTPGNDERASRYARQQNWPKPLAWDPQDIDDPKGKPSMYSRGTEFHICLGTCGRKLALASQLDLTYPDDKYAAHMAKGMCGTCYSRIRSRNYRAANPEWRSGRKRVSLDT